MKTYTLEIDGMSCGHCVAAVKQALEAVDGVDVENVSVGQARISVTDDEKSVDVIKEAVEDAGYFVTAADPR